MIHRIAIVRARQSWRLAAIFVFASIASLPCRAASAPEEELVDTLVALKSEVERRTGVDAPRFTAGRMVIERSRDLLARDEAALRAAIGLVATYDREIGPLWVSGKSFNREGKARTPPPDDIHWLVFQVMQALVDKAYTAENLERHARLLDGFRFGSADNFPGAVAPPADPETVYRVRVDGGYDMPFKHRVMHDERPARRPTGAYAAPGSIVTVTVPPNIVGKGYQIRVGAHTWDHAEKPRVLRLDRVSIVYPVDRETVRVASPLGGGVYLEVPKGAQAGVVELAIRNAVRSPFFSSTAYRPTSLQEWRDTERNFPAPWADLQSEKFLMQVPASWITKLDDPATLLRDWDKAMDAVTDLVGLPNRWGREVAYMQVDLHIRGSAYFPGYPMCNDAYVPGKDYQGHAKNYLVRGPQFAPDYPFHELGHGLKFVRFAGETESTVNLPHVAMCSQAFGFDLDQAFRASRGGGDAFRTLDTTAIAWMTSLNFADRKPMSSEETAYQLQGHAKYVDIAHLFGWRALGDFWRSWTAEEEQGVKVPQSPDHDLMILRLSQAAGADLRPLLHFWGRPPKQPVALQASIAAAKLPASAKIYDALMRYRSLLPADGPAFREFAVKWWRKPPQATGFTSERSHAKYWEDYNAATAASLNAAVQSVIDTYFPDGRPPG